MLKKVTRSHLVLHDPAYGVKRINISEVGKHLTGIAVELFPVEGFDTYRREGPTEIFNILAPYARNFAGASPSLCTIV